MPPSATNSVPVYYHHLDMPSDPSYLFTSDVDTIKNIPVGRRRPQHTRLTPFAQKCLSIIGLTGAAFAAYALDVAYSCGSGVGVAALYPASVCMVLLTPAADGCRAPKVIRLGTGLPV